MARKATTIFIIFGAIVLVVAVGGFIALNVINTRAESELANEIDRNLQASGMGEVITYGDVVVQSARGTVEITDLRIADPMQPLQIAAGSVSISVPPTEAVAFVQNPDTASFSRADIAVADVELSAPGTEMNVAIDSASLEIAGTISAALSDGDLATILRDVDSMSLTASDMTYQPGAAMLAQMQMMGGAEWITDKENRRIESVSIDTEFDPDRITVRSLDFSSPVLTTSGSGSLAIDEMMQPTPEEMVYRVESAHPEIRQQFAMTASMFGLTVPEDGPFTVTFSTGAAGPEFTIE